MREKVESICSNGLGGLFSHPARGWELSVHIACDVLQKWGRTERGGEKQNHSVRGWIRRTKKNYWPVHKKEMYLHILYSSEMKIHRYITWMAYLIVCYIWDAITEHQTQYLWEQWCFYPLLLFSHLCFRIFHLAVQVWCGTTGPHREPLWETMDQQVTVWLSSLMLQLPQAKTIHASKWPGEGHKEIKVQVL